MADYQSQIENLYQNYLGRASDAGGLQYWTDAMNSGKTLSDVQNAIMGSPEYAQHQQQLNAPKQDITGGLGQLGTTPTTFNASSAGAVSPMLNSTVSDTFQPTQTAAQPFGSAVNNMFSSPAGEDKNKALVTNAYNQYLNRAPDQGGLDFWTTQISSGAMTPEQVAQAIQGSAEAQTAAAPQQSAPQQFAAPTNDAQSFVTNAYNQYLNRAPDQGGLDFWSTQISSGAMTADQVAQAIKGSAEAQNISAFAPQQAATQTASAVNPQSFVTDAYNQYLGRAPDQGGLDFWTTQISSGAMTADQVAQAIKGSTESESHNAPQTITDAYNQYLNRAPDQAGLDYWTNQITSGAMTPEQAVQAIYGSQEAAPAREITKYYQDYLGRNPDAEGLKYWEDQLASGKVSSSDLANMIAGSDEANKYLSAQNDQIAQNTPSYFTPQYVNEGYGYSPQTNTDGSPVYGFVNPGAEHIVDYANSVYNNLLGRDLTPEEAAAFDRDKWFYGKTDDQAGALSNAVLIERSVLNSKEFQDRKANTDFWATDTRTGKPILLPGEIAKLPGAAELVSSGGTSVTQQTGLSANAYPEAWTEGYDVNGNPTKTYDSKKLADAIAADPVRYMTNMFTTVAGGLQREQMIAQAGFVNSGVTNESLKTLVDDTQTYAKWLLDHGVSKDQIQSAYDTAVADAEKSTSQSIRDQKDTGSGWIDEIGDFLEKYEVPIMAAIIGGVWGGAALGGLGDAAGAGVGEATGTAAGVGEGAASGLTGVSEGLTTGGAMGVGEGAGLGAVEGAATGAGTFTPGLAGAGATATGVTPAITTPVWQSALAAAGKGALVGGTLGGVKGAITGGDPFKSILMGAVLGGATAGLGSGITSGLQGAGMTTGAGTLGNVIGGTAVGAATGASPEALLTNAVLSGGLNTLSSAANLSGNLNIDPDTAKIITGMGSGAIGSAVRGGDAGVGALLGGIGSAIGNFAGSIGSAIKDTSTQFATAVNNFFESDASGKSLPEQKAELLSDYETELKNSGMGQEAITQKVSMLGDALDNTLDISKQGESTLKDLPYDLKQIGSSDMEPYTTFTNQITGNKEIVLPGGATVNLSDYEAAVESGAPISVDGQMYTGGKIPNIVITGTEKDNLTAGDVPSGQGGTTDITGGQGTSADKTAGLAGSGADAESKSQSDYADAAFNAVSDIVDSADPSDPSTTVSELFKATMGAEIDTAMLSALVNEVSSGSKTISEVASDMLATGAAANKGLIGGTTGLAGATSVNASGEMVGANNQPMSTKSVIDKAYEQYLGRAPESEGVKYWTEQVNSGKMTQAQVVEAIKNSQEAADAKKKEGSTQSTIIDSTVAGGTTSGTPTGGTTTDSTSGGSPTGGTTAGSTTGGATGAGGGTGTGSGTTGGTGTGSGGTGTGTGTTGTETGTGTGTTGTGGTGSGTAGGTGTGGTGTGGTGTGGTGTGGTGGGTGGGGNTNITTQNYYNTTNAAPITLPQGFDIRADVFGGGPKIDLGGRFESPMLYNIATSAPITSPAGGLTFASGGSVGISADTADLADIYGGGDVITGGDISIDLGGKFSGKPKTYAEGGEVMEGHWPSFQLARQPGNRFKYLHSMLPKVSADTYAEGGHVPEFYSEGGLNNRYVTGNGDGTSDDVPAMLANGEFVIPADVVSALGNGSNDSGATVLDEFLQVIRAHKQKHDPKQLPPDSMGPLAYLNKATKKAGK